MLELPLHPKLVHLPIALSVLVPLFATGLIFAWWRSLLPRRTWLVVVALQALLVTSGFAALQSGQSEEDRVERVVPEAALEDHEEAAEAFLWGSAIVLLVVLGASLVRDEGRAKKLATAAAIATLVPLGLAYRTGQAGGALVYRHGAATAYATGAQTDGAASAPEAPAPRPADDDDDD